MNRASSIAENCRLILQERCCNQQSSNHTGRLGTFPQQGCPPNTWKPCYPIPTNPIYSPYGVDNLRVPVVRCEQPSYYNTTGLSPIRPSNNCIRHPNCINRNTGPNLSSPSDNCVQMIKNAIITKIRYKIPQKEIALLCCCLPSLIRQIICKSPWLTPDDIIQCLSADIAKEAMNCVDHIDLNVKNEFPKSKQDHNIEEKVSQQLEDNKFDDNISVKSSSDDNISIKSSSDDNISIKSSSDDNDSLSSNESTRSTSSQQSFSSQQSSRSVLDLPDNIPKKHSKKKKKKLRKKEIKNRSPSTRSFTSQQSKDRESGSHHSITPSSWSAEIQSKKSGRDTPVHIEEDEKSVASRNKELYLSVNSLDSNEDFDKKSIDLSPTPKSVNQLSRIHIEYPGKKDPNVIQDVEKCLAFYQKIREYFDDDVAAMLLKCCLCYGDCSGKR